MVQLRDDTTAGRRADRPGAAARWTMLAPQGRAADRQQPARRGAGIRRRRAARGPGRRRRPPGARGARARRDPGPEHHRPRPARGRRSGAWSTIWASARSSPPRPSPTRPRPWAWPVSPPAARGRRCPSSRSAASTATNASSDHARRRRRRGRGIGHVRRHEPRAPRPRRWPAIGRLKQRTGGTHDRESLARRDVRVAGPRPAPGLALRPRRAVEAGTGGLLSRPRPAPISGRAPITASGSTTATRCWPRPTGISCCTTRVRTRPVHQYDQAGLMVRALAQLLAQDLGRVRARRAQPAGGRGHQPWLVRLVDPGSRSPALGARPGLPRHPQRGADYLVEAAMAGGTLEPAAHSAPARRSALVRAGLYACSPKDAGLEASFARPDLAVRPA